WVASYLYRLRVYGLSLLCLQGKGSSGRTADVQFNAVRANGLEECKRYLNLARAGKLPGNFLEGMACVGGCVGGPAALVDAAQGGRAVEKFRLA
ncbi:MAG: [Fe-Fe] hydrogenase large subunit C-terminal domain-containing protein, partial [Candidatus Hadarchaeum sp.]